MGIVLLFFVVLPLLFTQASLGQQMYRWKDEKGQWVYSNFVPSGAAAEKMGTGDTAPQSPLQLSLPATGESKKPAIKSDRPSQSASDPDSMASANRRLLVFPPADTRKPLSEWIPLESFANTEECDKARALQIASAVAQGPGFFYTLSPDINSRCISLAEFKPSEEANVIVILTRIGYDPSGFTSSVIYGKVFNRGQTTARSVVIKYQVRDTVGTIYSAGEIPTTPINLSPIMFAEFRGQILGSPALGDRMVHTEAHWLTDQVGHTAKSGGENEY
jgi:hypothetical protein